MKRGPLVLRAAAVLVGVAPRVSSCLPASAWKLWIRLWRFGHRERSSGPCAG